jgi:hypothetical protein
MNSDVAIDNRHLPWSIAVYFVVISLKRRSVQSQAKSGLPTRLIPVAFRRVNHTFLYLYPRDT